MEATGGGQEAAEALRRAGWPEVQHAIVGGIGHDLSSRASSVGGLVQLVEGRRVGGDGEDLWEAYGDYFRDEARRLLELAGVGRGLAGSPGHVETLRLNEVLPTVAGLHRRHRGLEHVSLRVEPGGDPVVRVDVVLLERTLLLLLAEAGWRIRSTGRGAGEPGERPGATLEVEVEEDGARVGIRVGGPAGTGAWHAGAPLPGPTAEAVGEACRSLGWGFSGGEPGDGGWWARVELEARRPPEEGAGDSAG